MKKFHVAALMFCLLGVSSTFAQENGYKLSLLTEFSYNEKAYDTGVSTNNSISNGKYLEGGVVLMYNLNGNFHVGAGFDYISQKETREGSLFLSNYLIKEQMVLKSNALMPKLRLGFEHQLTDKLRIGSSLTCRYGTFNTNTKSQVATSEDLTTLGYFDLESSLLGFTFSESEHKTKMDYFSSRLSPELTYQITKRIGLNLSLGGVDYSIIDWKGDASSWSIDFNPSNWKMGLRIAL